MLSTFSGLVPLIERGAVDRIVISTRAIPSSRVLELEQLCAARGVALSRLTLQIDHLVSTGEYSVSA